MAGKTLVVILGDEMVKFFFEGEEGRFWRIIYHPRFEGYFLVEEYKRGLFDKEFYFSEEDIGVTSLLELYKTLLGDPQGTLNRLLGKTFKIEKVIAKITTDRF